MMADGHEERKSKKIASSVMLLRLVFYFTLLFSLSELFASFVSQSLLLLEESVHMFADSISFGINLWAEKQSLSASPSSMSRAEAQMIGTGISCVTLIGTLLVVFVESYRRLTEIESSHEIEVDEEIMLGFGITLTAFHLSCLVAYFCGVNIPHGHGHSHGGDSHSGHTDSHSCKHSHGGSSHHKHADSHGHSHQLKEHHAQEIVGFLDTEKTEHLGHDLESHSEGEEHDHHSDNLVSAMFHVFVDCLHSFLVILTALVVMFTKRQSDEADGENDDSSWHFNSAKIDAISSLILCAVIFSGCIVLVKSFWRQFNTWRYTRVQQTEGLGVDLVLGKEESAKLELEVA